MLSLSLNRKVEDETVRLQQLSRSKVLSQPMGMLEPYFQRIDGLSHRMDLAYARVVEKIQSEFSNLAGRLAAYSPLGVLKRGYAIAKKGNTVVRYATELSVGDQIEVQLGKGKATCLVEQLNEE